MKQNQQEHYKEEQDEAIQKLKQENQSLLQKIKSQSEQFQLETNSLKNQKQAQIYGQESAKKEQKSLQISDYKEQDSKSEVSSQDITLKILEKEKQNLEQNEFKLKEQIKNLQNQNKEFDIQINQKNKLNQDLQQQLKQIQEKEQIQIQAKQNLKNQLEILKNEQIVLQKKCEEYENQNRILQIKLTMTKSQSNIQQSNQETSKPTKDQEDMQKSAINKKINISEENQQKRQVLSFQQNTNQEKIQQIQIQKPSLSFPVNPMQLKQIYDRKSLSSLIEEYKHNPNIKKIITDLQLKFDSYRSVRGDGNCYFRAVGFAFLEHLVRYTTPIQHLEDFINKMESNIGYYQVRSKSHSLRSNFLSLLQNLKQKKERNDASIQQYLIQLLQHNQHDYDEALIWQMRSLTANYLESHQEYFLPFCQVPYEQIIRNVLTMGKEADGIGIGPLQVVLKLKIEIVTIDRNYQEVLSFDQMKIAGKCPLIFILYKPGHYDIIYSKDQSKADGFDEIREQYTNQVQLPKNYDLNSPRQPFFVEIEGNGQECPTNEFKAFEIKYDQAYQSTGDSMQSQVEYIETEKGINPKIKKCEICQLEIEKIQFIELQCHHYICNYCLLDKIKQDTGGKIILNNNEKGTRANCLICKRELTEKEIEGIIGKEKLIKVKNQAAQRLTSSEISINKEQNQIK